MLESLDSYAVATFLIRFACAGLWTAWAVQVLRADKPLLRTARQMVVPVVFVGMWMLVAGSLVTLGLLSGDIARNLYTMYCGFAGLVALVLVTSQWMADD